MKITKQKTWMMMEIAMAAFLIASSCAEPGIPLKAVPDFIIHNKFQKNKPMEVTNVPVITSFIIHPEQLFY